MYFFLYRGYLPFFFLSYLPYQEQSNFSLAGILYQVYQVIYISWKALDIILCSTYQGTQR